MAPKKIKNCKHIFSVIAVMLMLFQLPACIKSGSLPKGSTSLMIVNAIPDSKPLIPDFTGGKNAFFLYAKTLKYAEVYHSNNSFMGYEGSQHLRLYQFPDTTVKDQPLFDLQLEIPFGSMNTMFLTGTTAEPDTFFHKESFPDFPLQDSVMAVRFVHLSRGSAPVTVNMQGSADNILEGLQYKQFSDFRFYPVEHSSPHPVFEIRDAISGNLITSYTFPVIEGRLSLLRRHFTVAFAGLPGETGTMAPRTFRIAHAP